ncbi:MAG: hypothetical protein NVS3B20_15020 [Polyangiales bacterium]
MTVDIAAIDTKDFEARASLRAMSLTLTLRGTADARVNALFEKFIEETQLEAARHAIPTVIVDFRKMEFMNSSIIRCFVTWLDRLHELPRANQCQIVLVSAAEQYWILRSLRALACFGHGFVRLSQED